MRLTPLHGQVTEHHGVTTLCSGDKQIYLNQDVYFATCGAMLFPLGMDPQNLVYCDLAPVHCGYHNGENLNLTVTRCNSPQRERQHNHSISLLCFALLILKHSSDHSQLLLVAKRDTLPAGHSIFKKQLQKYSTQKLTGVQTVGLLHTSRAMCGATSPPMRPMKVATPTPDVLTSVGKNSTV